MADTLPTGINDHTLIGLLQASVDRLKTNVDTQQVAAELRDRDEKRMAIMIKLAQEQVERSKETQDRLYRELDAAREELKDSARERERLSNIVADLEAGNRKASADRESLVREMAAQLVIERDEKARLARLVETLRKENADAKAAAITAANLSETQYRELFQDHATVKARLTSQAEEVDFLNEQRQKEARQVAEREYELNRTIGSLKKQVARLETDLDTQRKSSFETITVLQTEAEQLRLRVAQLESMLQSTDREGASRTQQLKDELRRLQERAELDLATFTAKEKLLLQETATLTANLRAAQKEINEMADKDAEGRRHDVDERIQLHADRTTLTAKVASLERLLVEATGQARADVLALKTDLEVVRNEKVLSEQRFAMELAVKRDENAKLKDELSLAAQQQADTTARATLEAGALRETIAAHEKDIKRLQVEIVGYKETVEKLDRHVRENYAVRLLEDELSSMKQQNVQLKNQLTHANSALANLRVEADITETSRMRTMHEQVLEAQRRVSTLERELRFARPLLHDLVIAARHANCLDAAVDRDVEMFFRQFGAGNDGM